MLRAFPTAVIENLQPLIDGGRYPVKRAVGQDLVVEADIFKDGHDVVAAILKWRVLGKRRWQETPMVHIDNDRWRGVCTLYQSVTYECTVEAWADVFRGWQREFTAKFEAGVSDLVAETLEGAALLEAAAKRAKVSAALRVSSYGCHQKSRARPGSSPRSDCASCPRCCAPGITRRSTTLRIWASLRF